MITKINTKILNNRQRGFSLVEMIVGAAIFAVIAVTVFQTYSSFISLVSLGRWKIAAADLANAEFELVRAMPYSEVGLVGGLPSGGLFATSTVVVAGQSFSVTRTIRNIDDPFDGTIGGSPNDLSPADYKMVQIYVDCPACKNFVPTSIVGYIAPKNLETASGNGALFIRVFDANGNPVQSASVSVQSLSGQNVSINDVTDASGLLAIIDVPPGINNYRIIATKSGFTTDRTYATSTSNPNPVKPDATVIEGQVTPISFVIDKVSTINVFSKDLRCNAVPNVSFSLAGAKLIGISPDVLKWSGNFATDSSGVKIFDNMEWDSFTITPGSGLNLVGINPPSPFLLMPNSIKNVDMIFEAGEPNNLLVTVKDSVTQLPLSEVVLTLTQGSFNATKVTGRGYFNQSDWEGGPGQENLVDQTRYWSDDGNIEIASPAGELTLKKVLGHYVPSGVLTSSIFDTGTTTNFSSVVWTPTSQPPQTGSESVKLQIATSLYNTATTTWTYLGPDGTSGTYYTLSNNNVDMIHNGDRYVRYRIFLSSNTDNKTPNISDIAVTYTSDCIPPGQAVFSGLSSGNHDLQLERSGYQTQEFPVNIITNGDWQSIEVDLLPQ